MPQAQNDVTAGDRGRTRTRSGFEDEIIVTVRGALVLGNVRPATTRSERTPCTVVSSLNHLAQLNATLLVTQS